jgi:1,3-propanediol dehydrogenase
MTGIAFDQSGLGLAHVLGHPMGGLFNIPHGVVCAMALPVAMEYNLMASPEKFAEIAELLGEPKVPGNLRKQAESAVTAVRALMNDLSLPESLSKVGIGENDIPAMVKDAMGFPGMIGANPRTADKSEIENLYRKFV